MSLAAEEESLLVNPPGNLIASCYKQIHDNSAGVLPSSACPYPRLKDDEDQERTFLSVSQKDFIPGKLQDLISLDEPTRRNNPHPSKMFMNWKVPARVLEDGDGKKGPDAIQRDLAKMQLSAPKGWKIPHQHDRTNTTHFTPQQQQQHKLHDRVRKSASVLPELHTKAQPLTASRSKGLRDRAMSITHSATMRSLQGERITKTRTRQQHTTEPLVGVLKPAVMTKATDWLKSASDEEREIVMKALRIGHNGKVDQTLMRTLQPNVKHSVESWLQTATDKEHRVALNFFQSLAGNRLMGTSSGEQQKRWAQVIDVLRKHKPVGVLEMKREGSKVDIHYPRDKDQQRLQYLRLLDPHTRQNKWMYSTWHHLPSYPQTDPVYNRSAILTEPHKRTPRHFVIHPDWG